MLVFFVAIILTTDSVIESVSSPNPDVLMPCAPVIRTASSGGYPESKLYRSRSNQANQTLALEQISCETVGMNGCEQIESDPF